MEAAQVMLFSMDILGEKVAGYQLEINGSLRSLVVRSVTESEFHYLMKAAAADARAERGRGGAALT
jgi:hypothetical protein